MMAMRPIQVSTDVYAAIWAARKAGEDSEDDILRRKFGVPAPAVAAEPVAPPKVGFSDYRFGAEVPEGFEIFRKFKGTDYRAVATDGKWLLKNTGDSYASLNRLSAAVGGIENAWRRWYYLDKNGKRQLIDNLRKPNWNALAARSNDAKRRKAS